MGLSITTKTSEKEWILSKSKEWHEREGISPWLADEKQKHSKFFTVVGYLSNEIQKPRKVEFPIELRKAIDESNSLLELNDDWDGEGSLGYSESTLKKTIQYLEENARAYFLSSGVWITAPAICPGPNGSIDLLWKLDDRELLINIPVEDNGLANYYGDDLGINTIKGKLKLTEKYEWILMWLMK